MRKGSPRPWLAEFNRRRGRDFSLAEQRCSRCKIVKPNADFTVRGGSRKGELSIWCKDCTKEHGRLYARKRLGEIRERVLDKYGRKCARCGFTDERALQIDHVHRNKNKDRTGPDFYLKVLRDKKGDYQLLCANCNWIKRHENGETARRINA